jgi:hypothetical protein
VSEVIVQPNFSFYGNSVTMLTGGSGTSILELASRNGFAGIVTVTCNPPFPLNYTCTLQQSSVQLGNGLIYGLATRSNSTTRPALLHLIHSIAPNAFYSLQSFR